MANQPTDKEIIVYTDGACFGNPGPGGYGVVLLWGAHRKEMFGGFRRTTNNRMEIYAAIMALRGIKKDKRHKIRLHSDSRLLTDAFNKKWIFGWEKKGWKATGSKYRLNYDLWSQLLEEYNHFDVTFVWVEGHAGVPENERCDVLSKMGAAGATFEIDTVYEQGKNE